MEAMSTVAPSTARMRLVGVVASWVFLGVLAGCSSTSPEELRAANAYDTVVRWLLNDELGSDPDPEVALFFESLTNEEIPLEVQVEMLGLLDDFETVRFIDEPEEAVDLDLAAAPVHDDGILIGLGAISADEPPVVRAELYRDSDRTRAYRFTLSGSGSTWRVDGEPEVIPVEEFTGVPDTDD